MDGMAAEATITGCLNPLMFIETGRDVQGLAGDRVGSHPWLRGVVGALARIDGEGAPGRRAGFETSSAGAQSAAVDRLGWGDLHSLWRRDGFAERGEKFAPIANLAAVGWLVWDLCLRNPAG